MIGTSAVMGSGAPARVPRRATTAPEAGWGGPPRFDRRARQHGAPGRGVTRGRPGAVLVDQDKQNKPAKLRDVRQLNTAGSQIHRAQRLASLCSPSSQQSVVHVGVHIGRAWPEECKQGGMAVLLPVARLLVLP